MFEYARDQEERRVVVEREVEVPARVLFDLLADPARHPLLDGSGTVKGSGDSNPARLSLGARFSMSMRMGAPYKITNTVVEFEEGRRIAWRHLSGHRWIWELEPVSERRTRVRETFDWSTAHTPKLIERLGFPEKNRRGMVATLERLESLWTLEGATGSEGAASAGSPSESAGAAGTGAAGTGAAGTGAAGTGAAGTGAAGTGAAGTGPVPGQEDA